MAMVPLPLRRGSEVCGRGGDRPRHRNYGTTTSDCTSSHYLTQYQAPGDDLQYPYRPRNYRGEMDIKNHRQWQNMNTTSQSGMKMNKKMSAATTSMPRATTLRSNSKTVTGISTTSRCSGVVKFFLAAENYGFILQDDGTEVFAHASRVSGRPLAKGDRVTFDMRADERSGKPVAYNVRGGTAGAWDIYSEGSAPYYRSFSESRNQANLHLLSGQETTSASTFSAGGMSRLPKSSNIPPAIHHAPAATHSPADPRHANHNDDEQRREDSDELLPPPPPVLRQHQQGTQQQQGMPRAKKNPTRNYRKRMTPPTPPSPKRPIRGELYHGGIGSGTTSGEQTPAGALHRRAPPTLLEDLTPLHLTHDDDMSNAHHQKNHTNLNYKVEDINENRVGITPLRSLQEADFRFPECPPAAPTATQEEQLLLSSWPRAPGSVIGGVTIGKQQVQLQSQDLIPLRGASPLAGCGDAGRTACSHVVELNLNLVNGCDPFGLSQLPPVSEAGTPCILVPNSMLPGIPEFGGAGMHGFGIVPTSSGAEAGNFLLELQLGAPPHQQHQQELHCPGQLPQLQPPLLPQNQQSLMLLNHLAQLEHIHGQIQQQQLEARLQLEQLNIGGAGSGRAGGGPTQFQLLQMQRKQQEDEQQQQKQMQQLKMQQGRYE
mmetsp:Transcript_9791/g.24172  ORF Transcript_9791/g.24172 Transcript_9791/m.24172 type:complete len:657 (-) Transcript_9791:35-2005(-)